MLVFCEVVLKVGAVLGVFGKVKPSVVDKPLEKL